MRSLFFLVTHCVPKTLVFWFIGLQVGPTKQCSAVSVLGGLLREKWCECFVAKNWEFNCLKKHSFWICRPKACDSKMCNGAPNRLIGSLCGWFGLSQAFVRNVFVHFFPQVLWQWPHIVTIRSTNFSSPMTSLEMILSCSPRVEKTWGFNFTELSLRKFLLSWLSCSFKRKGRRIYSPNATFTNLLRKSVLDSPKDCIIEI